MDFEIDDFYVGPGIRYISSDSDDIRKAINDYLTDEQKYMIVEIEEYDD